MLYIYSEEFLTIPEDGMYIFSNQTSIMMDISSVLDELLFHQCSACACLWSSLLTLFLPQSKSTSDQELSLSKVQEVMTSSRITKLFPTRDISIQCEILPWSQPSLTDLIRQIDKGSFPYRRLLLPSRKEQSGYSNPPRFKKECRYSPYREVPYQQLDHWCHQGLQIQDEICVRSLSHQRQH